MAFGDFTVTRASTKNILGSAGLYVSVANNVPAFEFNANGTYRGLLVEPGATNLALQSQDFGSATWIKVAATVTTNSDTSPDGTATADTITEDVSTGLHGVYQSLSVVSGTAYTLSVFVKPSARTRVSFQNNFGRLSFNAIFDLSAGTVVSGADATISLQPNGYYRITQTRTASATNTEFVYIILVSTGTTTSYTGNGTSGIFIWQAQLETGSVATSPIVTTAGTASRVADVVSLTGASSLIGQTSGTLYVEVDWRSAGTANQGIFYLSSGASANEIAIYRSGSANELRMLLVSNSVAQTNQGASSSAYSGIIKVAFAYAHNDCALYKDGASISTDAIVDLSALGTITQIDIGRNPGSTIFANMWIRSVAVFPTRLANATLESITTI
jgi:hypothetical protein